MSYSILYATNLPAIFFYYLHLYFKSIYFILFHIKTGREGKLHCQFIGAQSFQTDALIRWLKNLVLLVQPGLGSRAPAACKPQGNQPLTILKIYWKYLSPPPTTSGCATSSGPRSRVLQQILVIEKLRFLRTKLLLKTIVFRN